MIISRKISVQAATALLAAFAAVVLLAAAPSPAAAAPSYAWAIMGGGTGWATARGVSALPDGSSIITGYFNGTATFGATTLTSTSDAAFTAKVNADGSYAWAIQSWDPSYPPGYDYTHGVSALPDGSSIITGSFAGTVAFGDTTLISDGATDAFTAKVNADGSYAWATQSGGSGDAFAYGVSVLADGSSIITGTFSGSATFGAATLWTSPEAYSSFTAKVNADGSYAWATQEEYGTGDDEANGVSVLADGSSIITGSFNGTARFGDTPPLTSTGLQDTFTAKVNADGSYAWAIRGGGTGNDEAKGVSALPDGSSIITGIFTGTATFGTTPPLISTGYGDSFTAKVNADGSYAWAIEAGGTGNAAASGVSVLPDGSSIITGMFGGSVTFGDTTLTSAGGGNSFTAKVNADGSYAWAIKGGGIAWGVSAFPDGSSIITGEFTGTATFGTTPPLISTGVYGSFTARILADVVPPVPPVPPALFNLAVSKSGTGAGTVTSSPAGINCGADCSESLVDGSSVTLTAKPTTGSSFVGWSGSGCSGTSTCTVIMSAARAVDAKFTKRPSNVFPTPTVKAGASALSSSVRVPGPGKLTQRVTRTAAVLTVCKTSRKATKAGRVKLTCKLNAATRAALRKRSLRVRVKTTFTPTGGSSASKTQAVTLKSQRPPPYTG